MIIYKYQEHYIYSHNNYIFSSELVFEAYYEYKVNNLGCFVLSVRKTCNLIILFNSQFAGVPFIHLSFLEHLSMVVRTKEFCKVDLSL